MSKRQPKHEATINGIRVRVYASRTEYECLIGDSDISDPNAEVWCFPKVGSFLSWAHQAVMNHLATR